MAKSRRGVRFPNRQNGHGDRRASFSEGSEDGSSPTKLRTGAVLGGIAEVRFVPLPNHPDAMVRRIDAY